MIRVFVDSVGFGDKLGRMSKEYILLNGSRILYEEEYFVTDDGTPVFCWPSSFVLSNYIASHPELVQNKCVLELGAGVGLPGLVSAALGAHRVYFADKRENHVARRILERNLECNGFQSIGVYYPIDWGDCYPLEMDYPIEQLDIVIGSDLFYDPKQLEPTVMTIASLFRYHSVYIYIFIQLCPL